jgi:hypothetical protein
MKMMFSSVMLTGICLATCALANDRVEDVSGPAPLNISVLYSSLPAPAMPQNGAYGLPNMPTLPTGLDITQAISGMRDSLTNFQNLAFDNGVTDVAAAYVEYVRNAVAANIAYSTQNQDDMILDFFDHSALIVQGFLQTPPMMVQEGWFFGMSDPNVLIVVPTGGFFAP